MESGCILDGNIWKNLIKKKKKNSYYEPPILKDSVVLGRMLWINSNFEVSLMQFNFTNSFSMQNVTTSSN